MKNIKLAFSGILGFIVPVVIFAAPGGAIPTGATTIEGLWNTVVCPVSNWFFTIVLLVAVIAMLVSAWYFLRSRGNEQELETAKRYIRWALIGAAVAILSKTLIIVLGSVLVPGEDISGFLC